MDGGYLQRAQKIEEIIKSTLKGEGIKEVRGVGAMLGLELETRDLTENVVNHCFEKGILLGWTLHSNTLVRLAPPLIITDDQLKFVTSTIMEGISIYY